MLVHLSRLLVSYGVCVGNDGAGVGVGIWSDVGVGVGVGIDTRVYSESSHSVSIDPPDTRCVGPPV